MCQVASAILWDIDKTKIKLNASGGKKNAASGTNIYLHSNNENQIPTL